MYVCFGQFRSSACIRCPCGLKFSAVRSCFSTYQKPSRCVRAAAYMLLLVNYSVPLCPVVFDVYCVYGYFLHVVLHRDKSVYIYVCSVGVVTRFSVVRFQYFASLAALLVQHQQHW